MLALTIFVWQAVAESLGGAQGYAIAYDAGAAARLWFALTLRQTCLLVIAGVTLVHVRMGRSVSFGHKHWIIAGPVVLLTMISTTIACVLAGVGTSTFFVGLVSYSSFIALMSTAAFGFLIGTLAVIRRNLKRFTEAGEEQWASTIPQTVEEKERRSFATTDIEYLKDGASWMTSSAGSHRESVISAFSYDTRVSGSSSVRGPGSLRGPSPKPTKSSFWFASTTSPGGLAPTPPPPAPLRQSSYGHDADPFRCDATATLGRSQRMRELGSQGSWLSSETSSQSTLTAWSFPATTMSGQLEVPQTPTLSDGCQSPMDPKVTLLPTSRPGTPTMSNAQGLWYIIYLKLH
jgi:hypothetical protein